MDVSINNSEVMKNLQEFMEEVLPERLEQALERACLLVENNAKKDCPVDDGQLRNSITHKVKDLEGRIGSNVEYAPYVEIGTGIYSTQGTGRQTAWTYKDAEGKYHTTVGMKSKPYLKPAAEEHISEIQDCFKGML